jgi:hypothetical protein
MVNARSYLLSILLLTSSLASAATDAEMMEKARSLYARGDLTQAVEIYSQIPASSDFWLDAIEERAWAATRQNQFETALGDLQSITSSVWSSQVGPETYMLSTFVSLKICAYKDVVKKINLFKKRILPRVDALQVIANEPFSPNFWNFPDTLVNGQMTMASLGKSAELYPRYFYRDKQLLAALKARQMPKAEARMRQLAKDDLKEIEINLKKMKLIEVELIQNVLMADDLSQSKSNLKFSSVDSSKKMIFPVTDDEVWVDEVGHFQVKAEKCPFNKRSPQ